MALSWYDRFDAIPEEARIVPEDHGAPAWPLALIEAQDLHRPSGVDAVRYAVVSEHGRPVGWLPMTIVPVCHPVLTRGERLRMIVLGDAFGYCVPPLAVAPGHPVSERVHHALLGAAVEAARELGAHGLYIPVVPEDEAELVAAVDEAGFLRWSVPPWSFVPLGLGAPYPAALRSSYRSVLRKKRRALDDLGLTVGPAGKDVEARRLLELYGAVAEIVERRAEDYSVIHWRHPESFFARALRDPAFRVRTVTTRDGTVLAFNLAARMGDRLQSLVVGLDRTALEAIGGEGLTPAVYQALHADLLQAAEAEGCRWVNLGTGAHEGKVRLGAVFRPIGEAVRALTPEFEHLMHTSYAGYEMPPLPTCNPYCDEALSAIFQSPRFGLIDPRTSAREAEHV